MTPVDRLIRRLGQNPLIAGIVLTVVTIVLIGGVVLTMTSAGCGPANKLGLKGIANRCSPTSARLSPIPVPPPPPTRSRSSTPSPPPPGPPPSHPYPPPPS